MQSFIKSWKRTHRSNFSSHTKSIMSWVNIVYKHIEFYHTLIDLNISSNGWKRRYLATILMTDTCQLNEKWNSNYYDGSEAHSNININVLYEIRNNQLTNPQTTNIEHGHSGVSLVLLLFLLLLSVCECVSVWGFLI